MELKTLPTEIVLNHPRTSLGQRHLDWNPQPGAYLDVDGQTYTVLERRHRYFLKGGRYQLHKILLYVQKVETPVERTLWQGRWVMGDITCRYNARSEVLRCAVNPSGPCDRCTHYQPRESS
ncbi:MAG: DUF6464 family protein [Elainellaceae cyanobacterium]